MAEPTYKGYTGKNTDGLKSAISASKTYASDYAARKKKQEEDGLIASTGAGNSQEGATIKSNAPEKKKNTFLQDTVKNVGNALGDINDFLGGATDNAETQRRVNDANKKITADVVAGKITPGQAEEYKKQIQDTSGVGLSATEKIGAAAKGSLQAANTIKDAAVDSAVTLGKQVENSTILGQREGNTVLDDQTANTQLKFIDEDLQAGKIDQAEAANKRKQIAAKLLSGKESIKAATAKTGVAPDQSAGAFAALDTVGGVTGGAEIAAKVGKNVIAGNAAKVATKEAAAAEEAAKKGNAFIESGKPTQKLLSEPGESFYKPQRDQASQELDKLNNMDQQYLQENGLTVQTKSDGRKAAEELAQSPENVAKQTEAAQQVQEAQKQVDYYNQLKTGSQYHRAADTAKAKRDADLQQLVQGVQNGDFDASGARSISEEINKKYQSSLDDLAKKFPDDAEQAPILDQALEQASKARLEANMNATRIMQEQQKSIMESGGMLDTPDAGKIKAKQEELQNRVADLDGKVEAAKARASGQVQSAADIDERVNDLQDPELSPENFDQEGNFSPLAKSEVDNNRVAAAKAKFGVTKDTPQETYLGDLTSYEGAPDKARVAEYKAKMQAGEKIDPIIAIRDSKGNLGIEDGKHRYQAALENGNATIPVIVKDAKLNNKVTESVTTGKTATNETIDKILASDEVRPGTKAAVTNLTHAVHNDEKVLSIAKGLIDQDLDVARKIFDDKSLLATNADSHMALAAQLQKYYDNADLPEEAGAVLDAAATAVGNLARGTRAARFFNDMYSARNLTKHLDQTAYANGRNISEKYRSDFSRRAKAVENMKAGDKKTAMQVALKEESEVKGARARVLDIIGQAVSIPRTLLASGDFSAVGRQGLPLGTMHPVIFSKVLRDQPKMLMPKFFEGKMKEIRNFTDEAGESLEKAYKDSGVDVLAAFGKSEEDFSNTGLLEKVPLIKQYVGLSDRSYSGPLTQLRAEVFKKWVNDIGGVKAFNQLSKKEQTDMGKYINSFSGRGGFKANGAAEKAMEAASKTLFAPRFWKSNVDKINPVYYANLSPMARAKALKNLAPWLGTVGVVLSGAAAAGADVGTDPRSSDFGKIKVGDTRFDILGGTQQNFVLAARALTGQKTNSNGDTSEISQFGAKFGDGGFLGLGSEGPSSFGSSTADVIGDFLGNKTSPLVSYGLNIAKGKDIAGAPIDPLKAALDLFIPLGVQGSADTLKDSGGDIPLTTVSAGANFFGIGANTYGNTASLSKSDNEKIDAAPAGAQDAYKTFYSAAANVTGRTAREDAIKKLYKQGDVEKARRRAKEYNAFVDEKLQPYYSKYQNLDDDLRDELRNNLYITITPTKEKNWRE